MNEEYTELMMQQSLSADADAAFFEKLENTSGKKKCFISWKVAVATVCILLLIPVTAWAVESIFGTATVIKTHDITYRDKPGIGLQIHYEDIESYPIVEFPKHLQTLSEKELLTFDTWADAEQYLGIPLLSNPVLTDENTLLCIDNYWPTAPAGARCHGYCLVEDGQLFYGTIRAVYERNKVSFTVSAELTASHPTKTEEALRECHGIHIEYAADCDSEVTTNRIVTQNGIPVTILSVGIGRSTEYIALFAVNDISYQVRSVGMKGAWNNDIVYAAILEVLDGFILE